METGADKLVELALIAVEDVDVNGTSDAVNASVGGQLPIDQADIGLVFAVAGYPNVVFLFEVGGILHVGVDEHLVDIEDGAFASVALDDLQPLAHAA